MLRKITEQIWNLQVEIFNGRANVNCYLLQGEKGYTVLDTGLPTESMKQAWLEVIEKGFSIEKVVITHVHQDHVGLARWFQEKHGVPVYVSRESLAEIEEYARPDFPERFFQLLRKYGAVRIPSRLEYQNIYDFTPDGVFDEGDFIRLGNEEYQAIWTPGHAHDQYCFYQPERKIMFTGDHILQHISPVIGLWSAYEVDALSLYLRSLDKIEKYEVDRAFSGHGDEIKHFQGRIKDIRSRHQHRLQQVLTSIEGTAKSAHEVCVEIYGKEYNISQFMAILTRCIYLETIGKVVRIEREEQVVFKVTKDQSLSPGKIVTEEY